jgi:DNA-binding NtrC family response regulator
MQRRAMPRIKALLVMSRERRLPILEQLEACEVEVLPACNWAEASRILAQRAPVEVVLTDTVLPDCDWRGVLQELARSGAHAEVLVCARSTSTSLCSEVFKHGAYDLLVEPYNREELRRVLTAAAAHSYMRSLRGGRDDQPANAAVPS